MRGVSEEKALSAEDIRGAIIVSMGLWSRFVVIPLEAGLSARPLTTG
jgi:hypothetical protein